MSATLLLTLLLVLVPVAALVLLPFLFLRKESWDIEETPERFRLLQRSYERLLRAIKDLEFDRQVGSLSAEEYSRLRAEYKERAVAVRQELERVRLAAVRLIARGPGAAVSESERERIEGLVRRARGLPAVLLALGLLWTSPGLAQGTGGAQGTAPGVTVRGRVVDGAALARAFRPQDIMQGATLEGLERQALPGRKLRLHAIEGPTMGRSWEGVAGPDGRFELRLDGASLPSTPCLVAEVEGPPVLFSPAVAPSSAELEFRVYPLTESQESIEAQVEVYHELIENTVSRRVDLEVDVQLLLLNVGTDMYVGQNTAKTGPLGKAVGGREVFRIPVPAGASITLNRGPRGGSFTELPPSWGWKWLIIDSPVPPLLEDRRGGSWQITYRVPASQEMAFLYPVALELFQFSAWSQEREKESSMLAPTLESQDKELHARRPGETKREWTVRFRRGVRAGSQVPLWLNVDNARLGQVNRRSLLVVVAFLMAVLGAVALGLLLGKRSPSLDEGLEEASGEEIVARIAQLDDRYEAGEVKETTYRETRARLLSLARYLAPELGGGPAEPGGGHAGPASPPAPPQGSPGTHGR